MQSGTLLAKPIKNAATEKKLWWTELDGLRALAFLLVFYSHTTGLFWRADGGRSALYQSLYQIDSHLKNWGWIGVDLFFVLSAFLITSILLREKEKQNNKVNLKNFLTRRVLRIWPLYYFYLALVGLTFPILLSEQSKIGLTVTAQQHAHWFEQLSAFLVFLGNYSMIKLGELVTPLNPLWSLCIEEQFYIIWGLTMTLVKTRRQAVFILLSALAVAFVSRAFVFFGQGEHTITHLEYYVNGLTHMDSILMGALSAFIYSQWGDKLQASKILPPLFFALALATTGGIIAFAPGIESKDPSLIISMFAVALGWTFFLFATLTYAPVKRFFSLPLLTHLGRLTYGLYIFHFLAIYCVLIFSRHFIKTPGQSTSVLLLWGLALPLTYAAARLSWRYLEEPFIKLKSRF